MTVTASPVDLGYLIPTPADLCTFLSWPAFDQEQEQAALAHLDRAATLVRAYTRDRGFIGATMAPALRSVVLSAAARSMNNPTSDSRTVAGQYASSPGQPDWTLQERLILDGFRRRAA